MKAAMLSRLLAAILGGYVLSTLFIGAATMLLSLAGAGRAAALLAVTMAGFLLWAAIIMAVFHARRVATAWAWIAGTAAALGLIAVLAQAWGG